MKLEADVKFQKQMQNNAWENLKAYTDARIALGRVGGSLPTKPALAFQLAHAQAKDAVLKKMDNTLMYEKLSALAHEILSIESCAIDKDIYLKRPDLGRELSEPSRQMLKTKAHEKAHYDVVIVLGDGLSARAIEDNATPFVSALLEACQQQMWSVAPLILASGSRVALGDEVAEILNADMLVMLIGERPGLSSPDSMGIYYTWKAHKGCHDAMRNCISNVRPAGLSNQIALQRLMGLLQQSKKLGISGVQLKDEHEITAVIQETQTKIKQLF